MSAMNECNIVTAQTSVTPETIEQLQAEIEALKAEIEALKEENDALKKDVKGKQDTISYYYKRNDELSDNYKELRRVLASVSDLLTFACKAGGE